MFKLKKKHQKYAVLGILMAVIILALVFYFWERPKNYAKEQMASYNNYQYSEQEIAKVKKNEKDYIYYYAADGKRYVFPDVSVFKSWFGDYPVEQLGFESVDDMSASPLGGNVSLRPGTLLQSPTLLETFIVIKDSTIRPVGDEKLLTEFYGLNWENMAVELPDYYFSQYAMEKPIKDAADFPAIQAQLTIDQVLSDK